MRRFARDEELTDNQEGKVDPRYLAEVGRMTERRVRLHARREAATLSLVAAENEVIEAKKSRDRRRIRNAWKLVELRLAELRHIERLMTSTSGASSSHRGSKSIWPTHARGAVAREPDSDPTRLSDGRRHPVSSRTAAAS